MSLNQSAEGLKRMVNQFAPHKEPAIIRSYQREMRANRASFSKQPVDMLQRYFNRLKRLCITTEGQPIDRNIALIKNAALKHFCLTPETIPESYFTRMQQRLALEGLGGTNIDTQTIAQVLVRDQQLSLDFWLDYFVQHQSSFPEWFIYLTLRSVVKMGEFDRETGTFSKRSRNSTSLFPDLNESALVLTYEEMLNANGKELSFAKTYANHMSRELGQEINRETNNAGEWRRYPRGSNHQVLVDDLTGMGTGWCTRGPSFASAQLERGDFHIYFSHDKYGRPTVPRVAISMMGPTIVEVRGVAKYQNLDPFIGEVVSEKLASFGKKGEQYRDRVEDMQRLTKIATLMEQRKAISKADLYFLLEIERPIVGFGQYRDPRIDELKTQLGTMGELLTAGLMSEFGLSADQVSSIPVASESVLVYVIPSGPLIITDETKLSPNLIFINAVRVDWRTKKIDSDTVKGLLHADQSLLLLNHFGQLHLADQTLMFNLYFDKQQYEPLISRPSCLLHLTDQQLLQLIQVGYQEEISKILEKRKIDSKMVDCLIQAKQITMLIDHISQLDPADQALVLNYCFDTKLYELLVSRRECLMRVSNQQLLQLIQAGYERAVSSILPSRKVEISLELFLSLFTAGKIEELVRSAHYLPQLEMEQYATLVDAGFAQKLGWLLAEHWKPPLTRSGYTGNSIALRLIEAGNIRSLSENLQKFTRNTSSKLDTVVVTALLSAGHATALLEEFHNLSYDSQVAVFNHLYESGQYDLLVSEKKCVANLDESQLLKLIRAGYLESIASNIDKLSIIDEELFETLLSAKKIKELLSARKKLMYLKPKHYDQLVDVAFANGFGELLAVQWEYPFTQSRYSNNDIAIKLLDSGNAKALNDNLFKFRNLDANVFSRLISQGYFEAPSCYIHFFTGITFEHLKPAIAEGWGVTVGSAYRHDDKFRSEIIDDMLARGQAALVANNLIMLYPSGETLIKLSKEYPRQVCHHFLRNGRYDLSDEIFDQLEQICKTVGIATRE